MSRMAMPSMLTAHSAPRGLTEQELHIAMDALRPVSRRHLAWALQEILRELKHGTTIHAAIAAAIERLSAAQPTGDQQ